MARARLLFTGSPVESTDSDGPLLMSMSSTYAQLPARALPQQPPAGPLRTVGEQGGSGGAARAAPPAKARPRAAALRPLVALVSMSVLALAGLVLPASSAFAAPLFVVNDVRDAPDAGATRDGVCRTAAGVCTLRAALMEATAAITHATIAFALPGVGQGTSAGQISITSKLPVISNPAGVTIDGYTQTGSSPNTAQDGSNAVLKVEVVGPGITSTFDGLQFTSGGNVIRGLSAYGFRHVIWLEGSSANGNSIVGNFICTDSTGTFGAQTVNGAAGGVLIQDGASNNVVGAPLLTDRNIISGCAHRGVIVSFLGTKGNKIQNNVVGLDPSGTAARPNYSHGIDINYGAQDNVAGGIGPNERNIVSGNLQEGIEVSHGTSNRRNRVLGNCIGTDLTCTQLLTYTGNGMMGLRLEGEKDCNLTPAPPCDLNAGYAEVAYNVVVGNGWAADPVSGPPWGGMLIDKGQQHNWVHDNLIGMLPDGTPAGNTGYGLRIEHHAMYNLISGNTIANSTLGGVQITATESQPPDPSSYPTTDNPLVRNSIYGNGTAQTNRLGIDLAPFNVPNVNGTGDPSVAHQVQPPSIGKLTGTSITGAGCPGCTVEAYLADVTTLPSRPTYGQGKTFLASAIADTTTGAYSMSFASPLVSGQVVTADQTTPGEVDPADRPAGAFGDTSEFARDIALGGPAAPAISGPSIVGRAGVASVVFTGQGNSSTATATGTLTDGSGASVSNGPASVDPSTGTFSMAFDASPLADGTLTAAISVADSTGQASPSSTATLTKDSISPTVTGRSPAPATTVASPPSVVATPSEPLAPGAVLMLTGQSAGARSGSTVLSSGGSTVTFTPGSTLESDTWTASLTGTDLAGNAVNDTWFFTVDATPPAPPTLSVPPTVTGSTQAAVSVTGSTEPGAVVDVAAADSSTHTATARPTADTTTGGWSATLDMSSFADGTVTVTATATDVVGNRSAPAQGSTQKAALGPKQVSSSPAAGSTIRSPVSVSMTFDRALADGWSAILASTTVGPVAVSSVLSSDRGTVTATPAAPLSSGMWTLTLQASDLLGGSSTSSAPFTVDADAPAAPTLTLPTGIDAFNVAAVPISGSTTAEAGDTVTVTFTAGGTTASAAAVTTSTGGWSTAIDARGLPEGSVAVRATASDAVGNPSGAVTASLTKKTLASAPGLVPFTWTINSITAAWTAPTSTGGAPVDGYLVTWTPGGGVTASDMTTALSYTMSSLPEGTSYTITVAAHTSAGYGAATAPKVVTTKWRTSATIAQSTKSVPSGGSLTLSGVMFRTSSPSTPIVGVRLVLAIINASTGVKTSAANQIPTGSDGSWSYTYVPPKGTWKWQVTWVGDTVNGSASSAPTGAVIVN